MNGGGGANVFKDYMKVKDEEEEYNNTYIASLDNSKLSVDEKKKMILEFIHSQEPEDEIYDDDINEQLGIDLTSQNSEDILLLDELKLNKTIKISNVDLPERANALRFEIQFKITSKEELIDLINKKGRYGISITDIKDCYPNLSADVCSLTYSGAYTMACRPFGGKDSTLFPRNGNKLSLPFLVECSGKAFIATNASEQYSYLVTTHDLRDEVRRGDAILVGNNYEDPQHWFRINSNIKSDNENDQIGRSKTPLSVSSIADLSKKDVKRYFRQYTQSEVPLHEMYRGDEYKTEPNKTCVKKHGCTNDVRDAWHRTAEDNDISAIGKHKTSNATEDLQKLLYQHKLLDTKRPLKDLELGSLEVLRDAPLGPPNKKFRRFFRRYRR